MFLKIEQKNLLRATKNLKIFSAWSLGSQVYPTILVWCGYAHFGIYGGLYVKNGRFLSFFNSAGVLVQPWIRILMSKFEVFLECWKYYNTPFCTWNYVYFGLTNIFCCINHENSKFLEFSIFFFFSKFRLDSQRDIDHFFDIMQIQKIFMYHMSENQNFYFRQYFNA